MREVDIKILEALGYSLWFSTYGFDPEIVYLKRIIKNGRYYNPPPSFENGEGLYWLGQELVNRSNRG